MGKVTEIRVDSQGNLVEVKDKPDTEVIQFDVTTGTLKKEKPKKKSQRPLAGIRRFNRGGKV